MTTSVQVNLDLPAGDLGGDFSGAFSSNGSVVPARDAASVTVLATDDASSVATEWKFLFAYSGFPNRRTSISTPIPAGPVSFAVNSGALSTLVSTADAVWTAAFPNGIPVGTQVTLAGASLPSGLSAATPYWVVTTALGSFSLSATVGGSAITCGAAGVGTFTVTQYNYTGLLTATSARAPVASAVKLPQVTFITATGNTSYKVPAGAQTLDVTLVGAGAGGGSGAFASSGAAGGGSGGGGGGWARSVFQASVLTPTVTVSVGAGGTGGAAVSSPGAGNAATNNAGSTLFGSYMWAHGGTIGGAGNATNGATVGGGAGGAGMIIGSAGGPTVTTGAAGGAGVASTTCGGGAGGGVIAGPTAENGGQTGITFLGTNSNSSTGGIVGGASPTNGAAFAQGGTGPGGGGGAAATSGAAQNGADAQTASGAGGGGGGACSGGTTSGKGGNGGSGFALIIAYFQ